MPTYIHQHNHRNVLLIRKTRSSQISGVGYEILRLYLDTSLLQQLGTYVYLSSERRREQNFIYFAKELLKFLFHLLPSVPSTYYKRLALASQLLELFRSFRNDYLGIMCCCCHCSCFGNILLIRERAPKKISPSRQIQVLNVFSPFKFLKKKKAQNSGIIRQ